MILQFLSLVRHRVVRHSVVVSNTLFFALLEIKNVVLIRYQAYRLRSNTIRSRGAKIRGHGPAIY